MKKVLVVFFLIVIYFALANMQGCSTYQQDSVAPLNAANPSSEEVIYGAGPQDVIEDYFFQNQVMALNDLDETVLQERFGIDAELYTEYYGKYADGRFGVSDIFILKPAPGKEDALKDALENVRNMRISEFTNYNIYHSLENAEDALIFRHGEYIIMVMTDEPEAVRDLIHKYLPVEE